MSTAVTNNFAHTTPRASKSDDVYSYNKSSTRMVRALSRVRSKMSWSPRPLRSSLGGPFLGRLGCCGCCRFITPSFCRYADSWCHASFVCSCWRRSGDLDPIGCKAESCSLGRCCMFVVIVVPLPKSKTFLATPRERKSRHRVI